MRGKRLLLWWGCLGVLLLWSCGQGFAAAEAPRRVLLLNSYEQAYSWSRNIVAGVSSVLLAGDGVALTVENMDSRHGRDEMYFSFLREVYARKWQQPFDLVLAADDAALHFLLRYRQQLFPATPVVFCGINDAGLAEQAAQEGDYTGVVEAGDIAGTLAAALQVHPGVRRVYYINDETLTGRAVAREIGAAAAALPQLQFQPLQGRTLAELEGAVAAVEEDSLVLLLVFLEDAQGQVYSAQEVARRLAARSPVPIYGAWDFYLGYGIAGGKLVSGFEQGSAAARLALRPGWRCGCWPARSHGASPSCGKG